MPKYRLFASYGWVGTDIEEVDDFDSLEEAEAAAQDMAFERVEWGAEPIGEEDE